MRSIRIPRAFIFQIVEIKFIAPANEDAPAICKLKIAKSTDGVGWASIAESGGYTVQPVPAPLPASAEIINKYMDTGINQKLILLSRGNAISGAPSKRGTNQFPYEPSKIGITAKKIMIKAWAVIITL